MGWVEGRAMKTQREKGDKVFETTADGRRGFNGGRGVERGWRN